MSKPIAINDARLEPFESLFTIEKELRNEINRRAWSVLKELGYEWYRAGIINVIMLKRGSVDIVEINATYENNHATQSVKAELPLKQFEMLYRGDFAS